ncbi:RNA 3'-terminal phosphate cyclase, partial [bacterium LRH843]|nr:RNA 3'-terminal phosphate cyclase [bacterium LRH843]
DFFERAFLPQVNRMGPNVGVRLQRYGFMPAGGGKIELNIQPVDRLSGLSILTRGEEVARRVTAIVAQLASEVAEREVDAIRRKAN